MRVLLLAALGLTLACGDKSAPGGAAGSGGSGGSGGGDPGPRETWVADQVLLPSTAVTAFDLDGDGKADDQLGKVIYALMVQGLDLQATVDAQVRDGSIVQLLEAHAGAAASASFLSGTPGVPPCTTPGDPETCGAHLKPGTHFTAAVAADPPLVGSGSGSSFEVGPGPATVQISLLGSPPVALPLLRARAAFTRGGSELTGSVGGAIARSTLDAVVFPALQAGAAAAIARDCPGGACQAGSTGAVMVDLFDTDRDGAVSLAEIEGNSLIQVLFAPDIDTDGDGTRDAMSVALGLHLVSAVF